MADKSLTDHLTEAAGHQETLDTHNSDTGAAHSTSLASLSRLRDLTAQIAQAHESGNGQALKRALGKLSTEQGELRAAVAEAVSAFTGARRSAAAAKRSVARALESAPANSTTPSDHDATVNPNAAMGAQTSAGMSDRDYSPESIRQRDQRRAVEACHRARLKAEGGAK